MIAFQRLSQGPSLADLMCVAGAEARAETVRRVPLQAWCRPGTALLLSSMLHAGLGGTGDRIWHHGSDRPLSRPLRVRVTMQACFWGAEMVLSGFGLLHWLGLLGPEGVSLGWRWSEILVGAGMRLWRSGRPGLWKTVR